MIIKCQNECHGNEAYVGENIFDFSHINHLLQIIT